MRVNFLILMLLFISHPLKGEEISIMERIIKQNEYESVPAENVQPFAVKCTTLKQLYGQEDKKLEVPIQVEFNRRNVRVVQGMHSLKNNEEGVVVKVMKNSHFGRITTYVNFDHDKFKQYLSFHTDKRNELSTRSALIEKKDESLVLASFSEYRDCIFIDLLDRE